MTVLVRWAPRVRPELIRRLYETDARGLFDDELADMAGYALHDRCRSILRATEAHKNGRVECPGCGHYIPHNWDKALLLRCDRCAWQMTWGAYRNTFHGQRLLGGGAVKAFQSFVERFERAATYREKIMAIDHLIHAFHYDLKQNPVSPAARNLMEGNTGDIIAFLDSLAYGDASTQEIRETRAVYQETFTRAGLRRKTTYGTTVNARKEANDAQDFRQKQTSKGGPSSGREAGE